VVHPFREIGTSARSSKAQVWYGGFLGCASPDGSALVPNPLGILRGARASEQVWQPLASQDPPSLAVRSNPICLYIAKARSMAGMVPPSISEYPAAGASAMTHSRSASADTLVAKLWPDIEALCFAALPIYLPERHASRGFAVDDRESLPIGGAYFPMKLRAGGVHCPCRRVRWFSCRIAR
jgi:hypothetical protein